MKFQVVLDILGELKRRKVYRVAVVYVAVAFVLLEGAELLAGPLGLPPVVMTVLVVIALFGFPLSVVLAWAFELTPEGVRREAPEAGEASPREATPEGAMDVPAVPTPDAASGSRDSIVVLPFDNMSPDPEDAYLGDGLTEEITTDLSHLDTLRVISRSSATVFKGSAKDVRTIGRELGVRYVLEGSVRKAGTELRITAQLIDAETDAHLWAERYSGTMEDIFGMQEKVSRAIVDALQLELSPEEERQLAEPPIPDLRAYELYLRARAELFAFDAASIERAIRDLEEGLRILGENVLLRKALGMALFQQLNAGLTDDPRVIAQVEECAERIRAVEPDHAGVFVLRGLARVVRGDVPGATKELREAYRRDRSDPDVLLWLGVGSLSTGQMDLAGQLLHELRRLDPMASFSALLAGYHAFFEGRFEDAVRLQEESLRLGPDVVVSRWQAVRTFIAGGRPERARECAAYLRDREASSPFAEAAGLLVTGLDGAPGEMPEASAALRTWASNDGEWAQYLSDAYAFGGDGPKALEWLEIAMEGGFFNHAWLSRHDPFVADLRGSAEWEEALEGVRERKEAFEEGLSPLP